MNIDMIEKRLQIIQDLQLELNALKTQYADMLENDTTFQEIQEELKKIRQEYKQKQEKTLDKSTYKAFVDQIKDKKQELRENNEILSQELVEYYRESGSNEIEDADGQVKKMKFTVKLVNG